jgi:hypothetical protein
MRGSGLGRALDVLAAALFVFFLVAAVPQALARAAGMLRLARHAARETPAAARARVAGDDYSRAIDDIRRALPPTEAYLLVEGGRPQEGGAYWVRYDLAPRRALFLGRLTELTDAHRLRQRLGANLRHVVVAYGPGLPPRLYDRYRFVGEIAHRAGLAAAAPPATPAAAPPAPAPTAAPPPPAQPAPPPPPGRSAPPARRAPPDAR